MEQQHTNDEIDLGMLFKKLGDLWRSFLVRLFDCVQFVLRNWLIILLLLVLGIGGGFFLKKNYGGGYQSVLIIQNNFESSNYVYDALEKLKANERESWFREKYGFDIDNATITDVEIEPIISIVDLIASTDDDGRVLEQYLSEADFQEDLLLSEAFINEYQYHRVTLEFNTLATSKVFDGILNYLNDNSYFQKAKVIGIEEIKTQIKSHQKSIDGIDAVFFSYKDSLPGVSGAQFTFESKETTNLHFLLEEKRKLLDRISFLKTSLLKTDDVVYVINNKALSYRMTLIDSMHILLPLLLVVLFIIFSWLKDLYKRVAIMKTNK